MDKLSLNAPAKINIGLNIVSKRDDGFHNLETFFYPIYDLFDTLTFERNDNFIFDSNNTDLCKDHNNLVIKAHSLIEQYISKNLPLRVTLHKNIPIGAGMGGGSSDAAATLLGLNEFFKLSIPPDVMKTLALDLGSDVPFFILSKPSVGLCRGEILHQSNLHIDKPILIVNPGIHISTKEAFSAINPRVPDFNYNYFVDTKEIDYGFISQSVTNDFENSIFSEYEEIKEIKNIMLSSGSVFSLMSGTGSTVYGIFENMESAENAASKMPADYFKFISKS